MQAAAHPCESLGSIYFKPAARRRRPRPIRKLGHDYDGDLQGEGFQDKAGKGQKKMGASGRVNKHDIPFSQSHPPCLSVQFVLMNAQPTPPSDLNLLLSRT